MKAVVYEKQQTVRVTDVLMPEVRPDEVLIKVEAAGICGTDVQLFIGEANPRYPLIPGHEFSGVVTEVGSNVRGFAPGDRVSADPNLFCHSCYFCQRNMQNHCEAWQALGVTLPGGFAEYVVVPEASVYSIGNLSFTQGALIEPLACVVYGQQRARIDFGHSVLIYGAGPIGLMHLQLSRHAGASHVTVVDLRAERLEQARALGAHHTLLGDDANLPHELRRIAPRGFDLVVDATGVPQVVENALPHVMPGGTLLFFGVCPTESTIKVNPYDVYRRDLHLIGAFALRKTFTAARNLLEGGIIDVDCLVGDTVNMTDFPAMLHAMQRGAASMKIIVDPQNRQTSAK